MMKIFYHNKEKDIKKNSRKEAFSLIEIMVSLAVFAVAAVVAVGAFMSVLSANSKSQSAKNVINNINYALESMSREIRNGREYCVEDLADTVNFTHSHENNCLAPEGNLISFYSGRKTNSGDKIYYAYLYSKDGKGKILKAEKESDLPPDFIQSDFYEITSPNADIVFLKFVSEDVYSLFDSAYKPGFIKIYLKGISGEKKNQKTEFDVQTSISRRI